MYLLPECLNAVKYRAFWESTDQPSLKKFLDFRLSAGDIEDSRVEYDRYKKELDEISKFYAEASKSGQEVQRWKNAFKASNGKDCLSVGELAPRTALRLIIPLSTPTTLQSCALVVGTTACLLESKRSSAIKNFWKLQNERQNLIMKNQLVEDKVNFRKEKANAKVQKLQTNQYITVATVATEQIQQYAKSTTTSITKRFFDNDNERTAKRTRTNKDSEDDDGTENSPFLESVENLSSVSLKNQFSLDNDPFPMSGKKSSNNDKDIIDEFFSGPSTQVSHDLVMTEYPQQTLPCILKSGENFTDVWNKYLLKIDLHQWRVENDSIVVTFQNDILKSMCLKESWEQIRGQKLHLAEENLLERLSPVFQKIEDEKQSLLRKFAQVWTAIGEDDISLFEQYALLVIHIFISEFTSKRSAISHPSTTEAMWSTIMSFITGKAIRSGYVEYTWGEVELDSTALRKDSGRDILSLPRVATGHKGDGTGLSNDGRECFVMEISYAPQDQDRRKTAKDLYKLLREMRDMLHISKKEKRELGYKIPKEGLCVYGSQCYGYTQDLFEMEYINPFYIARKIGSVKISNNDITKLAFVLRMMWAFKERVASANEVWNNLESRYENYTTLESSDDGDNFTKMTPKKQSKRKENEKRFVKLEQKQLQNNTDVNVSDPVINQCVDTNSKSVEGDTPKQTNLRCVDTPASYNSNSDAGQEESAIQDLSYSSTETILSKNDRDVNLSCDTKNTNGQAEISELEQDNECDKNQIVERGLIEELHLSTENEVETRKFVPS
ncbi:23365_t:CDS:2 [Racocetra persica]|uniref:23365_t:CDS:1 n=1 Tax=Racocetra persica TaxID=160502 RepID=A0ACA9LEB8_9GLOM|nr:23365_t:CDS:2 [Racocetra persica]